MKLIAFFLSPLIAAAASIVGETIQVAGTAITVPAPPNFVAVTPAMKNVYATQREFVPSMNELLVGFIPAESAADALADKLFLIPRSFTVQTEKRVAKMNLSARHFAELKKSITSQNEKILKEVEKEMPGFVEKVNRSVAKETGVSLGLSVPQMTPLPPHEDTPRSIAYSTLVRVDATGADGKIESALSMVTGTFVHVRGKILFLYCNGGEKDLEWTRAISKQWSQAVLAANPAEGDGPVTSFGGRSFGSRVLRGALIGAVVGAVIGLFRYFSSKRKPPEGGA
jgi:hypothetical protein